MSAANAVKAVKGAVKAPRKLKNPTSFLRSMMRSVMAESGLEPSLFGPRFRLKSAIEGHVHFELDIEKDLTNRFQTIHGGVMASLIDFGGSLAVATTGRFYTGVSTDLNVTFLSPGGRVGDMLRGHAICQKIGRNLAFTSVQFYDSENRLAVRGSHTKYVGDTEWNEDNLWAPPPQYLHPRKKQGVSPPSLTNPYPREEKKRHMVIRNKRYNGFGSKKVSWKTTSSHKSSWKSVSSTLSSVMAAREASADEALQSETSDPEASALKEPSTERSAIEEYLDQDRSIDELLALGDLPLNTGSESDSSTQTEPSQMSKQGSKGKKKGS